MSSVIGVCSLYPQTAPAEKPPLKVAAFAPAVVPSSCFCLRRGVSSCRSLAMSAIAVPNSVLSKEGLDELSFTKSPLENRLEEEEDGGEFDQCDGEDEEGYGSEGAEGGGDDQLAIANLVLLQQLVGSLKNRGFAHLFPIQVSGEEAKLAKDIKLHAVPTASTSKRTSLSDPITGAMQPRAVRRPWYLSSGTGTLIAAANAVQLVPSKALAQSCDATLTQAGSNATCHGLQRLVLMELDPATAKLAISIIGPLLSAYGFLFIVRIVMSWYPKLPVSKFPYVVAYAPTEPLLILTRKLMPPLGGVDVTPVVWFGLISFLNEILVGPQGLLVLLSQQV